MAGDWIKMRWNLSGDPAVKAMSRALKLDTFGVIGRLQAFWGWADQHTDNGDLPFTILEDVDDFVEKRGFATELVRVGWLAELQEGGICIPNWDRHNGESAKKRCLTRARVEKLRGSEGNANVTQAALQNGESVTQAALQNRYQRREEKSIIPPTPLQGDESGEDPDALSASDREAIGAHTGFAEFWAAYPRKTKEVEAQRAWLATANDRPELGDLLGILARFTASDEWQRQSGQYVPSAHNWLRDQRWRDQLESVGIPSNPRKKKKEAPADWQTTYADVMGYECPAGAEWERLPDDLQAQILDATLTQQTNPVTE